MAKEISKFSRNELINRVQGYDFEGYDRTIDTHIKNLRKKIARRLPGQEIISTVYGVGYKFNAQLDWACSRKKNVILKQKNATKGSFERLNAAKMNDIV